jgi:hypothetical protein
VPHSILFWLSHLLDERESNPGLLTLLCSITADETYSDRTFDLRVGHGWPGRILGLLIAFAPIGIVWEDRLQSAEIGCMCRSINLLTGWQSALRFCNLTHQCRTNGSSPADTDPAAND